MLRAIEKIFYRTRSLNYMLLVPSYYSQYNTSLSYTNLFKGSNAYHFYQLHQFSVFHFYQKVLPELHSLNGQKHLFSWLGFLTYLQNLCLIQVLVSLKCSPPPGLFWGFDREQKCPPSLFDLKGNLFYFSIISTAFSFPVPCICLHLNLSWFHTNNANYTQNCS